MECPKCGAEQPESDTCMKCHVIISKFLKSVERSNMARHQQYATFNEPAVKGNGFPVKIVIFAMLIITAAVSFWWLNHDKNGAKGVYSDADGTYRNEKYRFKLKLPTSWKTYTVDEAIDCETQRDEYEDVFFLLASPTEPSHSLFVVSLSGITIDYFRATPWEQIVAETSSRHPVTFNSVETIGDFRVHRMGYSIAGVYREDNYFVANGELMLIYFYVRSPESSPALVEEMKNILEDTLENI
jgi:hypothetical protein